MKLLIIIPALVNCERQKNELFNTIDKLSKVFNSRIVVILQGKYKFQKPLYEKLEIVYCKRKLGKWGAINIAKSYLKKEKFVLLHDADDPFTLASYYNIKKSKLYKYNIYFGKRNRILLESNDQLSKKSRKYVELFLNTLIMNKYYNMNNLKSGIDIQSGLIILPYYIFFDINFSGFRNYGGELNIYLYAIQNNISVGQIEVAVNDSYSRKFSNYTIKQILNSSIKDINDLKTDLNKLLELTIKLYSEFLNDEEQVFKNEITYFLKKISNTQSSKEDKAE
jgi:hypothetical protein